MAIPAYNPYGWSTTGNTLQDLYQYYLTGGDDTAADTTDATTTSGIAGIYPYSQIGGVGVGGGVEGTPLIPGVRGRQFDPNDPLAYAGVQDPNLLTRGVNLLTKRPTATESFAGGEGGVGSMAGVTMGEKGLLNELLAEGYLVNTPGGLKTTSGKNVVSWKGGYEEGQEEAYQNYLDEYEATGGIQKAIDEKRLKGAKLKRFKESQVVHNYFTQQEEDIKIAQENIIKERDEKIADGVTRDMGIYGYDPSIVSPTQRPIGMPEHLTYEPTTPTISVPVPAHIRGDGADQSRGAPTGVGNPFGYAAGGIVDLL